MDLELEIKDGLEIILKTSESIPNLLGIEKPNHV